MYSGMTVNVLRSYLEYSRSMHTTLESSSSRDGPTKVRLDWEGRPRELGTRPVSLMNSNNNNNMHTKYAHTPTRSTK